MTSTELKGFSQMESPLVSISCVTYNHAAYIRQCIDSFLMQKCNFVYEILIHDDASTDGTIDIIKEYQEKYPGIIKPIIQQDNQWSRGVRGINIKYNFPRAAGTFIAMCEGDDYWSDPLKLQRQVDFLQNNVEYSMVTENSLVIDERNHLRYNFSEETDERDYIIKDLIAGRKFHMASILFKKAKFTCPSNYYDYPFVDTLIFICLCKSGRIKFLPVVSSIYRRNDGGVSNTRDRLKWAKQVEHFNFLLDRFLNYEYTDIIRRNISRNYFSVFKWSLKRGKISTASIAIWKHFMYR